MTDLVIVGGGPAGMAAAISAYESGIRDILVLERDDALGGILRQCIHNGFGIHKFGQELTGPEYAARYEEKIKEYGIKYKTGTMVLDIDNIDNIDKNKRITATNSEDGIFFVDAKAIILAMGCRERSKGSLAISGSRPSGIYTAGSAQKIVNIDGYLPGKNVVILGSGDIGLIMARRMTLEGANVKAVCEIMPYSSGLARNIEQCLNDFDIPLKLSYTVTQIHGKERLSGVTVSRVDERRRPIKGSEEFIECDTLLLSVGLIPENELSEKAEISLSKITGGALVDQDRQTSVEGIFSCGNVLHVHDLVDYVSDEAQIAGRAAADYINNRNYGNICVKVNTDGKVRYTVPQIVTKMEDVTFYFRVSDVFRNVRINVYDREKLIFSKKKAKVSPGEMESVNITGEKFEDGSELVFKIEEDV